MKQQAFEKEIEIKGVGLHSGLDSVLKIMPAEENTGIVFEQNGVLLKALYSNVQDTRNCTLLKKDGAVVSTIEHLMASLYILGIDNAYIKCSNPELPIMDGSAKMFLEKLGKENLKEQNASRRFLKVLRPVRFEDERGNFIELSSPRTEGLYIRFEIEFASKIVGRQVFENTITPDVFINQIAPARTFCEKYQIDYLRSVGLIKGGSLENAVVLDGEKILNPEGFRVENECVNHKVLDLTGDLYTSGFFILADVKAYKTGHFHNNEILKKLFENKNNYEIL